MQHQTPCLQYQKKKKNPPKAPPSNLAPQPIPNLFFSGDCYISLVVGGCQCLIFKIIKIVVFFNIFKLF
jgi:hypothetical protein